MTAMDRFSDLKWASDELPPCACNHRAVVLSCSHLARKWAVLSVAQLGWL